MRLRKNIFKKKEYAIFKSIKRIFFNDKDLEYIQICLKHNVTAHILFILKMLLD